jgi:tetratricopeptide (TPR) repeat protein
MLPLPHATAQSSSDSTKYHYQNIKEIKNPEKVSQAMRFFKTASDAFLKRKDSISATYYLEILSYGYFKMGNLYDSEATTINAYRILDQIKDSIKTTAPKTRLLNQLGMIYKHKQDYNNALNYYNKALALTKNTKNKIAIINNIANIYADQQDYKTAVENLKRYYDDVLLLKNSSEKATYLNNLGYYESHLKIPHALEKMQLALDIRQKKDDLIGLFSSHRYFTLYFKNIGATKKATQYAKKTLEIANQINGSSFQRKALELKLSLHPNLDFKDYIALDKRIRNEKQRRDNTYAAIKYDVEKERQKANDIELKLKTSEIEKLKERSTKQLFQTLGLLLLVSALFLYVVIRARHKKDKIKEVYHTETQISKKVHDELANDMSDLINAIEHDPDLNTDKKMLLLDNIEDIYLRTRDISTQTGSIDLDNYEASIKHLLMQHNKHNTKVLIHNISAIEWQQVAAHKKMVLYRCLQELMVNMKKHSKAKIVSIAFKNHGAKKEIRYVDDGVGCGETHINRNGLLNVESRIKGIGGTFIFKTSKGNGFKASIKFNS